jgi:hypothetical protein
MTVAEEVRASKCTCLLWRAWWMWMRGARARLCAVSMTLLVVVVVVVVVVRAQTIEQSSNIVRF